MSYSLISERLVKVGLIILICFFAWIGNPYCCDSVLSGSGSRGLLCYYRHACGSDELQCLPIHLKIFRSKLLVARNLIAQYIFNLPLFPQSTSVYPGIWILPTKFLAFEAEDGTRVCARHRSIRLTQRHAGLHPRFFPNGFSCRAGEIEFTYAVHARRFGRNRPE
jgi:hypothetical protein